MSQPTLFELHREPLAKPTKPTGGPYEASRLANEYIAALKPGQRKRVYDFLVERGDEGATDEEMQDGLQMNPSTQRPRRGELVEHDVVCDSGRFRPTRSGAKATVWVIVRRD